jgi:LPXTG-motif cell wall-anchored protein
MKKLPSFGVVAFAVLITGLAILGVSAPAQAYPEATIDLKVNKDHVYSGQKFQATASSDVECAWTLEWNGTERTGQSSAHHDFRTSFTAPEVTSERKIALNGECRYTAENASGPTTAQRTVEITVMPKRSEVSAPVSNGNAQSDGYPKATVAGPKASVAGPKSAAGPKAGVGGSDLPNTGGPNMLFLVGGIVLLLSGATAVTVARRRAEAAEVRASRF